MSTRIQVSEMPGSSCAARNRHKILLHCTRCGAELTAPRWIAGKTGVCPHCAARFSIAELPAEKVQPATAGPQQPAKTPKARAMSGKPVSTSGRPGKFAGWLSMTVAAATGIAFCVLAALALTIFGELSTGREAERLTDAPIDLSTVSRSSISELTVQAEKRDSDLASRAAAILQQRCYSCHGEAGKAEGGFNFVLSPEKMIDGDTYITAGDPASSYLFERIESGDMPPPGEAAPLDSTEIETIRQWIASGAPSFTARDERRFIRFDDMFAAMKADLEQTAQRSRQFIRYFSLTHLYNAGDSNDELETYRLALLKLMNSLSRGTELVQPESIDTQKTIFKIDLRELGWTSDIWGKLVDASPYVIRFETSDAETVYELTGSDAPLLRADWFVSAAAEPPLYHDILRIPDSLEQLLDDLRVDIDRNQREDRVLRVGFNRSGVSQNNRMIERHDLPAGGYVWISYDFAGNVGRQNLFAHPLGPGDEERLFSHDGGEIIFSLPNGLQAYMLVDAEGDRLDSGPTNIVSDPRRPDRAVLNGISCISCHFGGIIQKADEIRSHVLQNKTSFSDDVDEILAQYQSPDRVQLAQQNDARRFQESLAKMGIDRITQSNEPVFNIAARFNGELDAKLAAAELGLSTAELADQLQRSPETARALGIVMSPGGVIKRDAFISIYQDAVEQFNIARSPTPAPLAEPRVESVAASSQRSIPDAGLETAVTPEVASAGSNRSPESTATSPPIPPESRTERSDGGGEESSPSRALSGELPRETSLASEPAPTQANDPVEPTPALGADAAAPVNLTTDFQTYHDVSGSFSTEARLVRLVEAATDPFVQLQLRDGTQIDVPLGRLSEADRRRIRTQSGMAGRRSGWLYSLPDHDSECHVNPFGPSFFMP